MIAVLSHEHHGIMNKCRVKMECAIYDKKLNLFSNATVKIMSLAPSHSYTTASKNGW
jgi:hypothetical protein